MKKYVIILVILLCGVANAIDVIPRYAGSTSADSIRIPMVINDIDTVQIYEAMNLAGSDKIIIYRYGPSNTLINADTNTANIVKLRNGIYEARYKASDSLNNVGFYRVCVETYFKGKLRGGECTGYYVMPKGLDAYMYDIWRMGAAAGNCYKCTLDWYTRTLGSVTLTDSLVVKDSLGNRISATYYTRPPSSGVITNSGNR